MKQLTKRRLSKNLFLAILPISIAACQGGSQLNKLESVGKPQMEVKSATDIQDPKIILDKASDETKVIEINHTDSTCINKNAMLYDFGAADHLYDIKILQSTDSTFNSLLADGSLDVNYGLFNLSLSADYYNSFSRSTSGIDILITRNEYRPLRAHPVDEQVGSGYKILSDNILNDPNIFDSVTKQITGANAFKEKCNTGYVSKILVGAQIYAKLHIDTNDTASNEKIALSLKTSYADMVSLAAGLTSTSNAISKKFNLSADIKINGGTTSYNGNIASYCNANADIAGCISALDRDISTTANNISNELNFSENTGLTYDGAMNKLGVFKVLPGDPSDPSKVGFTISRYPTLSTTTGFDPSQLESQATVNASYNHLGIVNNLVDIVIRSNMNYNGRNSSTITPNEARNDKQTLSSLGSQMGTYLPDFLAKCFSYNTDNCDTIFATSASSRKQITQLYNKYDKLFTGNNYYGIDSYGNQKQIYFISTPTEDNDHVNLYPVFLNSLFDSMLESTYYTGDSLNNKKTMSNLKNLEKITMSSSTGDMQAYIKGLTTPLQGKCTVSSDQNFSNCSVGSVAGVSIDAALFQSITKTQDKIDKVQRDYYSIDNSQDHIGSKDTTSNHTGLDLSLSNTLVSNMKWCGSSECVGIDNSTESTQIILSSKNPFIPSSVSVNVKAKFAEPKLVVENVKLDNGMYINSVLFYSDSSVSHNLVSIVGPKLISFRVSGGQLVGIPYDPSSGAAYDPTDNKIFNDSIENFKLSWEQMIISESFVTILYPSTDNQSMIIYGGTTKEIMDHQIKGGSSSLANVLAEMKTSITSDVTGCKFDDNGTKQLKFSGWNNLEHSWKNSSYDSIEVSVTCPRSTSKRLLLPGGRYVINSDGKIVMTNWENWEQNVNSINPLPHGNLLYNHFFIGWGSHLECPGSDNIGLRNRLKDILEQQGRKEMAEKVGLGTICQHNNSGGSRSLEFFIYQATVMPIPILIVSDTNYLTFFATTVPDFWGYTGMYWDVQ